MKEGVMDCLDLYNNIKNGRIKIIQELPCVKRAEG
jgi:hypothetical protein